jgi:dsDNA-specific endonuclease/ATPase MutS2
VSNEDQSCEDDDPAEVCVQVGDEIDLHTFSPRDVPRLIPDYIDDCLQRGFSQVRIIHGKGKGVQRRIVHSALEKHAGVRRFYLAEAHAGGWGATIVELGKEES